MLSACTFFSSRNPTDLEAARPVKMDGAKSEAVIKEIEKDRADAGEWLRSNPRSYFAAIDRIDFGEKPALTIGRADDNDVRLSNAEIEPHHLRITVDGDQFRIDSIDSNATFKIKDKDLREVTTDPAAIQVGRFHLRLSHQRFPAIIVFDPQSPRMKDYKGLAYFPVDLSYRYELPLTRNPKPEKIIIMSTRGHRRSAERVGWFDVLVGNTPCRLEATRLLEPGSGESEVSVFFRDATSGKETYQLGRYVDAKKLENGNYLLDFNLAYNPACAFSEYYNCPIPPKENNLTVAIRAGEMDSHYH
jgi:uncharacterized protein